MAVKKPTTVRKVYYRRAKFNSRNVQNLQQLVAQALGAQSTIGARLESMGSMASEFRCVAGWKTHGHYLCGHLVTFERGRFQTIIDDDPTAKTLKLSAIAPPKAGKTQQQYSPGVLYFVLHKNHVVVMQATAIRATALEQHLLWLLRSKTQTISAQQGFGLSDEPQKATRERIRKSHVKSVMIGRPLMESTTREDARTHTEVTAFKPEGAVLSFLKEMLDQNEFEKLGLEDSLFGGNLEVWIQIRHPKRARSKSADSVKLLDDISIALRDLDEDEARLRLNDGSLVTGKDLKVSGDVEVMISASKGMLDENDTYDQMISWLETQLKNGVVEPD